MAGQRKSAGKIPPPHHSTLCTKSAFLLSLSFFLPLFLSLNPPSLPFFYFNSPSVFPLQCFFYSLYSFSAGLSFFSYFSVSLLGLSFWFCTTKVGARVPDVKRPFNVLLSIQSKLIRERDRTNIPFSFL